MDTYNGWKNWATWNVALWLGNDEHLYFLSRRFAYYKDLVEHLKVELVDAPSRSDALNVAWQYVKATWADHHDDTNPATASLREQSANLEEVLCSFLKHSTSN